MNNTKVAIVITDKRQAKEYFELKDGLLESLNLFKKNIEIEVFALTEQMNTLVTDKYNISFRNTLKALDFAINKRFEPDIVIAVGDPNFNYAKIFTDKYKKKILIHKGNSYPTNVESYFDYIIVETQKEEEKYKNSIVKSVVNTKLFNPKNSEKYFTVCYPQNISDEKKDFFEQVRVYGSISQYLDSTVRLPLNNSELLATIINQSKLVSLLEDNNSVEYALSALACNTPVLTTIDTKAANLPPVLTSNVTTPEFINKTYTALNLRYNYFEEYIKPNYSPDKYSKMLMDLI
jgi:hypothetical protein